MPAAPRRTRSEFVRHPGGDPIARLERREGSPGPDGPTVSIVIPTADGDRFGYLQQLLAQIQEQTFQDLEVLLVRGDNRQGRAINLGAEEARGEFLLTFDDDTRVGTPDLVARLVEAMRDDPSIGMAGVENRVPEDASPFVRRLMREVPRRSSPPVDRVTDSDMAEHPCLMMRKEAFYQVGGEHEGIPRGLDPYLRREFRRAGYRVVVVPGVWIHHLPPPTLRAALRQFYRNGRLSALVGRTCPDLALDNSLAHDEVPGPPRPRLVRALRHAVRMAGAALTFRWVYLLTAAAYGAGVLAGSLERPRH